MNSITVHLYFVLAIVFVAVFIHAIERIARSLEGISVLLEKITHDLKE